MCVDLKQVFAGTWGTSADFEGALTLEPDYCPGRDCVEGIRQPVAAIRRIAAESGIALG